MKRISAVVLSLVLIILMFAGCGCEHDYSSSVVKEATYEAEGEMSYTCTNCGDSYTEVIAKLEKHVVPTEVLEETLANTRYQSSVFSISVEKLVEQAMDNYKVTYYSGEEAIEKGLVQESEIDASVDINYLYYGVISGDTMMNPEIPYMTRYEEKAIEVWMVFDESDQLVSSGITLCSNLQTCAILLMSSF